MVVVGQAHRELLLLALLHLQVLRLRLLHLQLLLVLDLLAFFLDFLLYKIVLNYQNYRVAVNAVNYQLPTILGNTVNYR